MLYLVRDKLPKKKQNSERTKSNEQRLRYLCIKHLSFVVARWSFILKRIKFVKN